MINLDKLPQEPSQWNEPKLYSNNTLVEIEVLSRDKVPLSGVSCKRDGVYACPTCRRYTLDLVIDYRCVSMTCNSRIIKYKKYDTEETVMHPLYDTYIDRFYEDVERRMNELEKNKRAIRNQKESNK